MSGTGDRYHDQMHDTHIQLVLQNTTIWDGIDHDAGVKTLTLTRCRAVTFHGIRSSHTTAHYNTTIWDGMMQE